MNTSLPNFVIQGFSELQPLIQQAMQDNSLKYGEFGSKCKNTRDQSHSKGYGKNKGKSKSKKGSDSYRYCQAHHSYADTQDYSDPQFSQEHT